MHRIEVVAPMPTLTNLDLGGGDRQREYLQTQVRLSPASKWLRHDGKKV
jgi:hypothetical protein